MSDEWEDRIVKTGRVDVDQVLFNPDNFKIHPRAQQRVIETSLSTRGWFKRVLINLRTSELWQPGERNVETLMDGHARTQIAARKGQKTVPAEWVDLTPEEEAAVMAEIDVVTTMAGVDRYKMAQLLKKTPKDDKTQEAMGLLAKKAKLDRLERQDALTSLDKVDGELEGVRTLKNWVHFESDLPWGFPQIKPDKILMDIPENLQVWVGPKHQYVNPDYFMYQWDSDSIKGLDLHKTMIAFYVDDWRFDNFWYDPAEYTGKLLNSEVMAVVMPNFSVAPGDPLIVRMWQRYRALFLGRYFQEAGIPIIPDIPIWSGDEDNEMLIIGIPENVPIAVQMHTKMTDDKWLKKVSNLRWIMDKLNPIKVIIYADEKGWEKTREAMSQHAMKDRLQWVQDRLGARRVYMDAVASEEI